MTEPTPEKPRRKPRPDRSELPLKSFLPENNAPARLAYRAAMFGLVPFVGLLAGPVAVVAGLAGRAKAVRDPDAGGWSHAVAGAIVGALETLCNGVGLWLVGRGVGWWA